MPSNVYFRLLHNHGRHVYGITSGNFRVGNVDVGDVRGKENRGEAERLPCVGRTLIRDTLISFCCFLVNSGANDVIQCLSM